MALTKLNSLAIPPDTVVESDISFPLDSASFTGNLTVDTDTLAVDATNNRVGIGNSNPQSPLDINNVGTSDPLTLELGGQRNYSAATYGATAIVATSNGTRGTHDFGAIRFEQNPVTGDGHGALCRLFAGGQSSSFESKNEFLRGTAVTTGVGVDNVTIRTNDVERMRIDNAGRVLVNQLSQDEGLIFEVGAPSGYSVVGGFHSASTQSTISFKDSNTTADYKVRIGSEGDDLLIFAGGLGRMRITSEGRVSNGTGSSKNYTYFPLPFFHLGASGINDEYLIVSRYNDTGSAVLATGVDGEILFSRGGLGSGNAQDKIEIGVQDAWTVSPRTIRFNTTDVRRFIRLDVITVDSQKYLALRGNPSGGGSVNHLFFRGIVTGESVDSKLLTRVRESDSNVTLNTSGVMYPAGFEYRDDTTGGFLGIRAGGAEVGQFKSTGLHFENGKGIDFGASAGSSSTSQLLDDYEEGTWTPNCTTRSGAFTVYGATYTRIGQQVTVQGYFDWNSNNQNNNGNQFFLGGLPYDLAAGLSYAAGTIAYSGGVDITDWYLVVLPNSDNFYFTRKTAAQNVTNAMVHTSGLRIMIVTMTYITDE